MVYNGFMQMQRGEILLDNSGGNLVLNHGTAKHRQIMNEIDKTAERILDPDIVRYLLTADTSRMNQFDRLRLDLASIENERTGVHVRKLRMKRNRNGMLTDEMACPVCLRKHKPKSTVIILECGHVLVHGEECFDEIMDNGNLRNACPSCRKPVNREEIDAVYLKFNHNGEPICRYCEYPFRDSDGENWCMVLRCGHAYHRNCLADIDNNCTHCNNIIGGGKPQRAFLHYE